MRRPRFIAEQARHARGVIGRLIAEIMARETWRDNLAALDALAIEPADHVLDVGCGHGRTLGEIARRAPRGRAVGVDPSALMADLAASRRANRAASGRVDVLVAKAERLPFESAAFDKVVCVHTVYFWPDLGAALGEIARVSKPGARLALVARTAANHAAASFPASVYRFPTAHALVTALDAVGYSATNSETCFVNETNAPALIIATRMH